MHHDINYKRALIQTLANRNIRSRSNDTKIGLRVKACVGYGHAFDTMELINRETKAFAF